MPRSWERMAGAWGVQFHDSMGAHANGSAWLPPNVAYQDGRFVLTSAARSSRGA